MKTPTIGPGWLVLFIFVMWGVAGKLDEMPGEIEPDPSTLPVMALAETSDFPPIHLVCFQDEGQSGNSRHRSDAVVFTSFQPAQRGSAVDPKVAGGRRLQCVVIDEQETP